MPCNAPISGWKNREMTARGMRAVTFRMREGFSDLPVSLPCGKCAGCMVGRAREWSIRCVHEAQMWAENCFVTLTYNDKSVPKSNGLETLRKRDFVNFMKKLRKEKPGVRFLQSGEYGMLGRPHHHCLLFNCHFSDRVPWRRSRGYDIFRSAELETIWTMGFSEIGTVTAASAGYVARYTTKKMTSGNVLEVNLIRVPEYMTMSRNPGIGKRWLDKYFSDVYPSDEIVVSGGHKMRPPRYYDDVAEKRSPEMFKGVSVRRQVELSAEARSGLRNSAREVITRRRLKEEFRREL